MSDGKSPDQSSNNDSGSDTGKEFTPAELDQLVESGQLTREQARYMKSSPIEEMFRRKFPNLFRSRLQSPNARSVTKALETKTGKSETGSE